MSTRNCVRKKLKDIVASATEFVAFVETGGITFNDGRCLELIKDNVGSLALLDSTSNKCHQQIDLAGQRYVPPTLPPSMLEALTLPMKRTDYGSTVELFGQICNFFLGQGVSEDAAQVSTYFAFATWFPESLPVAPCLILTGVEAEARVLLQLLTCVVRHGLQLAEINMTTYHRLPMHIQPTMLIGYVHQSMWRLYSASSHPHTYVSNKNGLTDLYCAKAAYAGSTSCGVGGDGILNINCTLYGGMPPIIKGLTLERIAAHFQSKLVDYRFKHVAQVREADFDAKTLPTPLRMLARALGSCIVGAPELQADIVRLLESRAEELRANCLLDPNHVVIEAMFARGHGEKGPIRVGVSEIATLATDIMADRGESTVFESKAMGSLIRRLGFRPMRDCKGFAIHLTPNIRRLIHRLARDHRVGASAHAVPGCPDCAEGTSAQAGRLNS